MYQLNTVSFHPIIITKLPGISEERSYEFTITYELLFFFFFLEMYTYIQCINYIF